MRSNVKERSLHQVLFELEYFVEQNAENLNVFQKSQSNDSIHSCDCDL